VLETVLITKLLESEVLTGVNGSKRVARPANAERRE
jgi:hypothetical protein